MKSNRYVIAFSGVILHLMLGSTYAWSVYRNPIIEKRDGIRLLLPLPLVWQSFVWDYRLHLWGVW